MEGTFAGADPHIALLHACRRWNVNAVLPRVLPRMCLSAFRTVKLGHSPWVHIATFHVLSYGCIECPGDILSLRGYPRR
jgi:hypothetical protein